MRGWLGETLACAVTRHDAALLILAVGLTVTSCGADPDRPSVEQNQLTSARPTPSPSPEPEFGWTITEDNVGLRSHGLRCGELAEYDGPSTVPAGARIRERRITQPIDLSAGRITIERSCIQPASVDPGMPVVTTTDLNQLHPARGPVLIRDSDFDGSLLDDATAAMATAFVGIANLRNNYIHHFGTGISFLSTGEEFDAVIEHNYVTNLVSWGDPTADGNHSDGFTIRDFDATTRPARTALVRNNRFNCDSGNDTGAVFLQTYAGRIENVTLEGNLLEGGGYQLGLNETNHPYLNVIAINNRFSGTGYGPAYVQGGAGWTAWADNYVFNPAMPQGRGEAVPEP